MVQGLRRELPGGAGFLGGRAGLHWKAQRNVERGALPAADPEWEYAARAGDTYAGDITQPFGNDPVLNRIAWYDENSGGRTQPVGQKAPNAFLHDMLGNVWEWVGDWYGSYPGGTVTDPEGPASGSGRVRSRRQLVHLRQVLP